MIDRAEIFNRWHSLALLIGTRAAGATKNFQPTMISGSHEKPQAPNASDWHERKELQGGMLRWLADMNGTGENVVEAMHEAITRASNRDIQRLLACIERAEWLLKQTWRDGAHRKLTHEQANRHGREALEQSLVMRYRGVRTQEAADDAGMTVGSMRWIRRKHGLSNTGERMYPCTIAPVESCTVCGQINTYADYDESEAA